MLKNLEDFCGFFGIFVRICWRISKNLKESWRTIDGCDHCVVWFESVTMDGTCQGLRLRPETGSLLSNPVSRCPSHGNYSNIRHYYYYLWWNYHHIICISTSVNQTQRSKPRESLKNRLKSFTNILRILKKSQFELRESQRILSNPSWINSRYY